jgi:hypothetical protein
MVVPGTKGIDARELYVCDQREDVCRSSNLFLAEFCFANPVDHAATEIESPQMLLQIIRRFVDCSRMLAAAAAAAVTGIAGQNQPNCINSASTGLNYCGNWAESMMWTVPSTAISG